MNNSRKKNADSKPVSRQTSKDADHKKKTARKSSERSNSEGRSGTGTKSGPAAERSSGR